MISFPSTVEDIFENGIKRFPGAIKKPPRGKMLNLGCGKFCIAGAINLDLPEWRAPDLGRFNKDSIAAIHMYHFLEHLSPDDALRMLHEVDRVLMPGGVAYIVVPHAMCPLAYQAPDHRSFWTEEGLQDTFYSAGYDTTFGGTPWNMDIVWMQIAGIRWSNLCVMAQLAERIDGHPYQTPWSRDAN